MSASTQPSPMSTSSSNAVVARSRSLRWPRWLRQLGWPGLVGAALLMACTWFTQLELPRRHGALAQAESDVRRLRHGLIARATPGSETSTEADRLNAPSQAWASLWSGLPDEGQRMARQARVLDSAAQVGVPLQSVQWQGEAVKWLAPADADADAAPSGLWRQRMTMPVQAPYPALRTWLDRLQREPGLTVDAIDIQRNDVQSDQVRAQVSLSLWWRQSVSPLKGAAP
jgi:hypothetical protein